MSEDPLKTPDPIGPSPLVDENLTYNGAPRCRATSRRTGERCRRAATPGTTVCANHGSKAPQVKQAARLRLLSLVDPAIATLAREMAQADRSNDRQRAANSILDRAGVARSAQVQVEDAREALLERLRALRAEQVPDAGEIDLEEIDE